MRALPAFSCRCKDWEPNLENAFGADTCRWVFSPVLRWPEMFSVQCWGLFSLSNTNMSNGPKLQFNLSCCLALKAPGALRGLLSSRCLECPARVGAGCLLQGSASFLHHGCETHVQGSEIQFSSLCSQRGIQEHSQSTTHTGYKMQPSLSIPAPVEESRVMQWQGEARHRG